MVVANPRYLAPPVTAAVRDAMVNAEKPRARLRAAPHHLTWPDDEPTAAALIAAAVR